MRQRWSRRINTLWLHIIARYWFNRQFCMMRLQKVIIQVASSPYQRESFDLACNMLLNHRRLTYEQVQNFSCCRLLPNQKTNVQTFTLLWVCSVASPQGEQYCQNREVIHHLSAFSCTRLTRKEDIFIYLFFYEKCMPHNSPDNITILKNE